MRILVAEQEPKTWGLLHRTLTEEGYAVDTAVDGLQAIALTDVDTFDAMVLDATLSGLDGFEVCAALRRRGNWLAVLMLTATDAVTDRVHGLDDGADDYLPKPFSRDELLARLRALIRRGPVERPTVLTAGDLTLDPATRTVHRGQEEIPLTSEEHALLEALMRRPGTVLTHSTLVEHCWDPGTSSGPDVIDGHIQTLRAKIDRPYGARSVETVRCTGYRIRPDGGPTPTRTT
ncbi:DNA-binding response regulator [Streptomyces sp. IMTB 2501]|uniref:response regulator transcription factor n=1 Tax=Streptomyces sp. IMTB 2501 TaxID=1776340 RepID=UPI00096D03C4|nr:response regulator transcription factor [Streptomyces sp. IMTB 2501]OLZ62890.1 DNA-binding response regulator [Streptomyces sp. IMTB 2501]